MNQKPKIIFVDLDGTALDAKVNGRWTISKANRRALVKIRKLGVEVIASTGRIGWTANRVLREFGGNYFIQGNGSLITNDANKTIFEKKIPKIDVIRIVEFAQAHGLIVRLSYDHKIYGANSSCKIWIARKLGTEFTSGYNYDTRFDRHKILLFGYISKWKTKKIAGDIRRQFPNLIVAVAGRGFGIELTFKGASKGYGAQFITQRLGFKKQETIHIGDEMNDATVKNYVGTLIAMKNANPNLKKIADHVGANFKNGGLAHVLEKDIGFN